MARFEVISPDELLKQLNKLENIEPVAVKMVSEAIPIVARETSTQVSSHRKTGALEDSVTAMGVKVGKSGVVYDKVCFEGYDGRGGLSEETKQRLGTRTTLSNGNIDNEGGVPNALKAAVIEYGRNLYGTSKVPAKPFLANVISETEQEVVGKMQDVFNREVGKE